MDNERYFKYARDLTMLKILFANKKITEFEYKRIEKDLKSHYGIDFFEFV